MREWMDRDVQDDLEVCWARSSSSDARDALLASMRLFERLAGRTAEALGFEPFDGTRVRAEVDRILARARAGGLGFEPRSGSPR
jgi:aminoglycoside 6-adenylyltransferase